VAQNVEWIRLAWISPGWPEQCLTYGLAILFG